MRDEESRIRFGSWPLFAAVAAFFVVFLLWAGSAEIDQVTRGPADVVPTKDLQKISHFEGGILQSLEVREGERVRSGEVIGIVKNTQTRADYQEAVVKVDALKAKLTRLKAELDGGVPDYHSGLKKDAALFVAEEKRLSGLRREALKASLEVYGLRAEEMRREVDVQQTKLRYLRQQLRYARDEAAILEPLVESGSAARTDLLKVKRTINELESEIATARNSIPKSEEKLAQIKSEREQARSEFRSKTSQELNETRNALAKARQQTTQAGQQVQRTKLRASTDGIVQSVNIPTTGGVVEPGETIVEIVPITETLRVEARIKPADVAFLHPGQAANVKISAYDYAVYGGVDASVESISADTLVDEKTDERYYRVTLRTETNAIAHKGQSYPIQPGMTAQVDILTGKETVLDIALAPVRELFNRALRER